MSDKLGQAVLCTGASPIVESLITTKSACPLASSLRPHLLLLLPTRCPLPHHGVDLPP